MMSSANNDALASSAYPWNPALYEAKNAFVFHLAEDILAKLAARAGESILDLGCGTGQLTDRLASQGTQVTGLDASVEMLTQARTNYPNVSFVQGDVRTFRLNQRFDAIFSNAALHWVAEHDQVARSVFYHLKPGGRFVAELGGKGNLAAMIEAVEGVLSDRYQMTCPSRLCPWTFPTLGQFTSALESQGLRVLEARWFERLTPLAEGQDGMRHWLEAFMQNYLTALPASQQPDAVAAIQDRLRPRWFNGSQWHVDYARLQVVAIKPRVT